MQTLVPFLHVEKCTFPHFVKSTKVHLALFHFHLISNKRCFVCKESVIIFHTTHNVGCSSISFGDYNRMERTCYISRWSLDTEREISVSNSFFLSILRPNNPHSEISSGSNYIWFTLPSKSFPIVSQSQIKPHSLS
jgi:hypothetical protein